MHHSQPTMGDAIHPDSAPQRSTATVNSSMRPAGWRLVNFKHSNTRALSDADNPNHRQSSTAGWSAVHDFERRLSRNGIKVSEAVGSAARSTIDVRSGALARGSNHHATRSEDFPPLETSTIASFTSTKETRVEALERLLQQAQTEARIWKEKSELAELHLRASYQETMEWRMKYEDFYSVMIRGQDPQAEDPRAKRGVTKSWG